MQITFDTNTLNPLERAVIAAALGYEVDGGSYAQATNNFAPEAPTQEPTKRATRRPASPKQDPEATAEPEPSDEPEASSGLTQDDAIAKATTLMRNGKAAHVKKALADLGVDKVSKLKDSQIGEFIKLLED